MSREEREQRAIEQAKVAMEAATRVTLEGSLARGLTEAVRAAADVYEAEIERLEQENEQLWGWTEGG